MSAVEQMLDVDALIPDGIEPVEASRCWSFVDGKLASLTNGEVWTPGEPLAARCTCGGGKTYSWNVVRRGMSYEVASGHASRINGDGSSLWSFASQWGPLCPYPSKITLPPGYGFEFVVETHEAPHENCTCGIYAATTAKQLPTTGDVYGKVKLWGKVIPGEKGVRAQFAYPSEFHVHPGLADDPALKAFGVPIIAKSSLKLPDNTWGGFIQRLPTTGGHVRKSHALHWAVAANLAACAVNLSIAGAHFLG